MPMAITGVCIKIIVSKGLFVNIKHGKENISIG